MYYNLYICLPFSRKMNPGSKKYHVNQSVPSSSASSSQKSSRQFGRSGNASGVPGRVPRLQVQPGTPVPPPATCPTPLTQPLSLERLTEEKHGIMPQINPSNQQLHDNGSSSLGSPRGGAIPPGLNQQHSPVGASEVAHPGHLGSPGVGHGQPMKNGKSLFDNRTYLNVLPDRNCKP